MPPLCRFANSSGFSLCKQLPERKACDRACGKKVPKQCHRKIFQDGARPYGGELCGRNAAQNDIEQDSGNGAHSRTHDKDSAAGNDQCAEEWVILFGVDKLCSKAMADAVAPESGKEENKNPHEGCFDKDFVKDMVRHIAEAAGHGTEAKLVSYIENLHAIGHGDGHKDTENDSLRFCFRHK